MVLRGLRAPFFVPPGVAVAYLLAGLVLTSFHVRGSFRRFPSDFTRIG